MKRYWSNEGIFSSDLYGCINIYLQCFKIGEWRKMSLLHSRKIIVAQIPVFNQSTSDGCTRIYHMTMKHHMWQGQETTSGVGASSLFFKMLHDCALCIQNLELNWTVCGTRHCTYSEVRLVIFTKVLSAILLIFKPERDLQHTQQPLSLIFLKIYMARRNHEEYTHRVSTLVHGVTAEARERTPCKVTWNWHSPRRICIGNISGCVQSRMLQTICSNHIGLSLMQAVCVSPGCRL